jgi:hypothetical protein
MWVLGPKPKLARNLGQIRLTDTSLGYNLTFSRLALCGLP